MLFTKQIRQMSPMVLGSKVQVQPEWPNAKHQLHDTMRCDMVSFWDRRLYTDMMMLVGRQRDEWMNERIVFVDTPGQQLRVTDHVEYGFSFVR